MIKAALLALSIGAIAIGVKIPAAYAEDIKVIRHATESWGGFTNEDGTGLYHELFREIFKESGAKVEVNYVPLKRAVELVKQGRADLTGGFNKDDRPFAKYPVFESSMSIIFRKDKIKDWNDVSSLKGLRLVGPAETAKASGLPVTEVDSRWQAATLMLKGRADGYVDLTPILTDFKETKKMIKSAQDTSGGENKFEFDADELRIETVKLTQLFMVFSDTERGKKVREMYEEGTRRMKADGRLDALYSKYKFQTPTIE